MGYTFGDSDIAARRLDRLAEVYAPSSAELLRRWAPPRPELAVDIGCGPGHTTRLLRDVCGAAVTVGVDSSPRYIERARSHDGAVVRYLQADVSCGLPDTAAGAQLLYCRFLLTHLSDPPAALESWRHRAGPDAVLIVEELEWLRSEHPALRRYYDLVESVQDAHGQEMCIGASVADTVAAAGWVVRHTGTARLAPPVTSMAQLHALNLTTLRNDPALASVSQGELDHLARSLDAIAVGREAASVDNGMRQVVAAGGR